MELIHLKAAAKLVQESPENLQRLIESQKIEVYPQNTYYGRYPKIIKSSLLAYYQQQLLQEIRQQMPQARHTVSAYQSLQYRIARLQNFGSSPKKLFQFKSHTSRKVKRHLNLSTSLAWSILLLLGYFIFQAIIAS